MMREAMPFIPGALRAWLLEQQPFLDLLHGGTVSTRSVPDPLTKPHVHIATIPGGGGQDPMLRRFLLQVTPWAPDRDVSGIDEDPDVTVWKLAATAGELLGRAKNVVLDDQHAWSAAWLEGPFNLDDTKRGEDRPLFYAPVRFQVHLRRRSTIIP